MQSIGIHLHLHTNNLNTNLTFQSLDKPQRALIEKYICFRNCYQMTPTSLQLHSPPSSLHTNLHKQTATIIYSHVLPHADRYKQTTTSLTHIIIYTLSRTIAYTHSPIHMHAINHQRTERRITHCTKKQGQATTCRKCTDITK